MEHSTGRESRERTHCDGRIKEAKGQVPETQHRGKHQEKPVGLLSVPRKPPKSFALR